MEDLHPTRFITQHLRGPRVSLGSPIFLLSASLGLSNYSPNKTRPQTYCLFLFFFALYLGGHLQFRSPPWPSHTPFLPPLPRAWLLYSLQRLFRFHVGAPRILKKIYLGRRFLSFFFSALLQNATQSFPKYFCSLARLGVFLSSVTQLITSQRGSANRRFFATILHSFS